MDKIASPQELISELQDLLTYAKNPNPSREKLASDLANLAERIALTASGSGRDIFYTIVPEKDVVELHDKMEEEDQQTATLFIDVIQELQKQLTISSGAEAALSRIIDVVHRGLRWDMALIRNNVFKAANSLGMKLPSHSF
jgi:hypothetical protein